MEFAAQLFQGFDMYHAIHGQVRVDLQAMGRGEQVEVYRNWEGDARRNRPFTPNPSYLLIISMLLAVATVMFGLSLGPLLYRGLQPTDDGPDKIFVYAICTLYHGVIMLSWMSAFTAMLPEWILSGKEVFLHWLGGVGAAVFLTYFLVEGLVYKPIFPVPYSIFYTGMGSYHWLEGMTVFLSRDGRFDANNENRLDFRSIVLTLITLASTTLLAGGVAALSQFFKRYNVWVQFCASVIQVFVRFVVKICILSPMTKEILEYDFVAMNLNIDIAFSMVNAATIPFIENLGQLAIIVFVEGIVPVLRCAGLIDRVAVWREGWLLPFICRNQRGQPGRVVREACQNGISDVVFLPLARITNISQQMQREREVRGRLWIDRALFHHLDVVGGRLISILVRSFQLFSLFLVRASPSLKKSLYPRFDISDVDEWNRAVIFGFVAITIQVLALLVIGKYRLPLLTMRPENNAPIDTAGNKKKKKKKTPMPEDNAPIYMNCIIKWIMVDHAKLLVPWLTTAAIVFVSFLFVQFGSEMSDFEHKSVASN